MKALLKTMSSSTSTLTSSYDPYLSDLDGAELDDIDSELLLPTPLPSPPSLPPNVFGSNYMNSSNNNSSNINNDSSSALLDGLSIGHRVASFLSLGDVDGFGAMFFDTDSRGNAVPVYSPADANRPTPDSEESSVDLLERGMQQLFLPEEPQTNSPSLSPERTR